MELRAAMPSTTMTLSSSSSHGYAPSAESDCVRKIQALFRGRRCRLLHVERVRKNLPWSPFVPAKMEAVDAMLALAQLQPGDTLLDIGSGDGRVLLAAAAQPQPLKAVVGVEIDSALVATSRRRIADALRDSPTDVCVKVLHADWLEVDMHDVDVVILFFLPHADIAAALQDKLRVGTRVITYVFQIRQWTPDAVATTVPFMTDKGSSCIYRYIVPPRAQRVELGNAASSSSTTSSA